jgi:hypothetical protein
MPWASTRTVPPSLELDAVFTTALDPSLLAGVVAVWLAAPELFELLPQPASKLNVASAGIRNFRGACTYAPLPRARSRGCEIVTL